MDTTMYDLAPAADRLKALLPGITDEHLSAPTPCPEYNVGALLGHVMGLSVAFRHAATKDTDAPMEVPDDFRTGLPALLDDLVESWRNPDAWEGTTAAGGVTLSGAEAGQVALDELVLHGWDLARATGQPFEPDEASVEAALAFTSATAEAAGGEATPGLFGPAVEVPADAPPFDRALGYSGRDPSWTPPG